MCWPWTWTSGFSPCVQIPKNAPYISNTQDLFDIGILVHAPDCGGRHCFMVQGTKKETNTSGQTKMPDHYQCTITCAFCWPLHAFGRWVVSQAAPRVKAKV